MTTLVQVLRSVTDGTHAPPAHHEVGLPLLSAKDIRNGGIRVADPRLASADYVSSEMRRTSLAEGDVLLTIVGTIGRSAVVGPSPRFAMQRSVAILKPECILPHFLSFYLRSPDADVYYRAHARGTAQRGLYLRDLKGLPVPLPPHAEQERIVAAIEEQFSRLDAGVAALGRARSNAERIRLAVLQSAVTGSSKLTKASLDDANFKLPTGWDWRTVDDVANLVVDGDHNPPKRTPNGVPHLTARHVRNGALTFDRCSYVSEADFSRMRRRYEPWPGDLIVTCVGTLGETALVPPGVMFSADRNLAAIRMNGTVRSAFLKLVLDAPAWQRKIHDASGSTAQPHLYLGDLRRMRIPVPPLPEQDRIVDGAQDLLAYVSNLKDTFTVHERRTAALRSSILAAAFSGKLVAQAPDDEPASVLLERIAAERALSNGHKPDHKARQERLPV